MNKDFFFNIINSAQIGSALLLIAVALWILVFKKSDKSKRTSHPSHK